MAAIAVFGAILHIISAVLIIGALKTARKVPTQQWSECSWCLWWISSAGHKRAIKPSTVPTGPHLHCICNDCRAEQLADFRKLRSPLLDLTSTAIASPADSTRRRILSSPSRENLN